MRLRWQAVSSMYALYGLPMDPELLAAINALEQEQHSRGGTGGGASSPLASDATRDQAQTREPVFGA